VLAVRERVAEVLRRGLCSWVCWLLLWLLSFRKVLSAFAETASCIRIPTVQVLNGLVVEVELHVRQHQQPDFQADCWDSFL
jgi:hypothetical protein